MATGDPHAIELQLKTDIETTAITACHIERPANDGRYPCAEFYWGGGGNPAAAGNSSVVDWTGFFTVRVKAGSREAVLDLWRTLLLLWYDATRRATLAGLGVLRLVPASTDPPVVTPGGKQTVIMDMDFEIQVRFSA